MSSGPSVAVSAARASSVSVPPVRRMRTSAPSSTAASTAWATGLEPLTPTATPAVAPWRSNRAWITRWFQVGSPNAA